MNALVRFGETVLEHGRDFYGPKHTPLIPDYLEVNTLRAPEKMYITRLGGPGPRSKQPYQPVISSNLAFQGNLSRFLVGLSNLTGDSKFKEAYKDCIRYYYQHYQVPNGLLQMGHHRFINLSTDAFDGDDWPSGKSGHEMKRDYPYYPLFWETDPNAARRMLTAHWSSHIQDWGFMNFTRHGSYVKELNEGAVWNHPITRTTKGIVPGNLTFFDSGSDIIWAGAQLGILNQDDRPIFWAHRLYARYAESAHPDTGLPPWHHTSMRDFGTRDAPVPEYALITSGTRGLLGNGGVAMLRLGEDLADNGEYYRETMLNHLKAYAKWAYKTEKNELHCMLFDGTDLTEREQKTTGNAESTQPNRWRPWSPDPTTIVAYAICYRQSRDDEIWETLRAMCRGNDLGDIGDKGGASPQLNLQTQQSNPRLIFPLIEIYRATKNRAYLALGRIIGNNAVANHFRKQQGLFTPSELHRTANLCSAEPLALLTLEAALSNKLDQVPDYVASHEAEHVPFLRPLRSRPYRPRASHAAYPFSVEAICDDLLPKSSADTSVPVMAWQNVRKATDEASVTFPDILTAPATISEISDHAESRNSVSEMNIDSPHGYTFAGQLYGTGDLTVNVLRGEHIWAKDSRWMTVAWSPTETYDLVMNIAKDSRLTFKGLVQEVTHAAKWGRGAGIIKNGDGTAELTADHTPLYNADLGNNRAYRSPTVVNDGLLLVNNTTGSGVSPRSSVHVNHGGTLGGNGTIGIGGTSSVVVVHAGGKLTPGDGIGTMTLRDGMSLRDGARMEFDVGDQSDLLKITGGTFHGCDEDGVVITIRDSGGMKRGKNYELIDWTGASYIDVDVDDFKLDKSQNFQGSFHFKGTKLIFSVFAPRLIPETPPALPPAPKLKTKTSHQPTAPTSQFRWSNPSGGRWTDQANWQEERIPNTKQSEWIEYRFEKPRAVSSVQVYWFDDGNQHRIPSSWQILYHQAGKWKPVELHGAYSIDKDKFNSVSFAPITSDRLRLSVDLQPGVSAGIHEWRVLPE